MKTSVSFATIMLLAAAAAPAAAQTMPDRAIIVSGDTTNTDNIENVQIMYSRKNLAFYDPAAPRFLFLDKKGTVALGIGGYMKASGLYDFRGAIPSNTFYTNMISVPSSSAHRKRFGATAAHSTIFLKLVSRPTSLGRVIVYIATDFAGGDNGYGLKLDQAYVAVGHILAGKARSTFSDPITMAPTIDDQGPAGQVGTKNMLVQYETDITAGISAAISAEVPQASYTLAPNTEMISQRFPDIPAYVQYAWHDGDSHIRLSGIVRGLSYNTTTTDKNHFVSTWGVQLSGTTKVAGGLRVFGHYIYGTGIGSYINDLSGMGFDLVPDGNGELKAAGSAGWTAGARYDITPSLFVSGFYSQARVYDIKSAGMDGDTYHYGQYIAANAFYNITPDLRVGAEYLHGVRTNLNGQTGRANRVEAMVQYSF